MDHDCDDDPFASMLIQHNDQNQAEISLNSCLYENLGKCKQKKFRIIILL